MKRFQTTIIVILLAFAAGVPAFSQFRYGLRLSGVITDARMTHAPGFSVDNKGAFSGGLVLEYQVPDMGLAVDGALLYTRFNARFKDGDNTLPGLGRNFLEIPIHAKYKFWLSKFHNLVAPMVYTGPSFMFRIDKGGNPEFSSKVFQPGWDVGLGIDIVNFIQITGGYRFGMGNALENLKGNPDAKFHTDGWNISATILFDF